MREIAFCDIVQAVSDLCVAANCVLPPDLCGALLKAEQQERSPVGQAILSNVEQNFILAKNQSLPLCQDTGMAVVYCDLGQEAHITGGLLSDAVNAGVALGYTSGSLRCSVVADPLRRENTGDNAPAVLHLRLVEGDALALTLAPRGFGSENKTALRMFAPTAALSEVEDFIVNAVSEGGTDACPPLLIGVGLGGTSEQAVLLSKRALLRNVGEENPDLFYADLESALLSRINDLGLGPQGLGGTTTALSVSILTYPTHMAGLPCAVHLGCHASRRASCRL